MPAHVNMRGTAQHEAQHEAHLAKVRHRVVVHDHIAQRLHGTVGLALPRLDRVQPQMLGCASTVLGELDQLHACQKGDDTHSHTYKVLHGGGLESLEGLELAGYKELMVHMLEERLFSQQLHRA